MLVLELLEELLNEDPFCEGTAVGLRWFTLLVTWLEFPAVTEVLLAVPVLLVTRVVPEDAFFERVLLSDETRSLLDDDEVPEPERLVVLLANILSDPVSCLGPLQVSTWWGVWSG